MEKKDFDNYQFTINTLVKIEMFDGWHKIHTVNFERRIIKVDDGSMWIGYLGIKDIKN